MNYISSNGQTVFDGIMCLLVIVAAVATWSNSKSAKKTAESDNARTAIEIGEKTIAALKQDNADTTDRFTNQLERVNAIVIAQGKEIAGMQAQLKAKDELIERYLQLLQNRNPEIDIFMKQTSEALTTLTKLMQSLLEGQEKILAKPTVSINNQPTA